MQADSTLIRELCRYNIGTYADVIYRNALLHPDLEAFVYGRERVTFSGFNARVNALIHTLNLMGFGKGDVIGLLSWNCLECCDVYGAAMKGGFIASPFNPRLQAEELEYLINYSESKVLFVGPELWEMVEKLQPRLPNVSRFISLEGSGPGMIPYRECLREGAGKEPNALVGEEDPFIIFYTSGTTGLPRGALYTHFRKLDECRTKSVQLGAREGDRHIMVLPLFHIGGWSHFWTMFYLGGCNIIMPERSFDPAATLEAVHHEQATDIHIVPTQLVALLAREDLSGYDLTSLKRIWYAASPMPVEILRRGIEAFGPIFMQCYGQSESGPDITFLSMEEHDLSNPSLDKAILGSCGRPCRGVHVRIIDQDDKDLGPFEVGEIVVRSKRVMKEYWNRPEETREAFAGGWLHTGDMGYYDKRGYIFIVDRKKDMIISGGENIYPREIEEILYKLPEIEEVAVIGVPDPYWVERVHAVIVLKKGEKLTQEEVKEFSKKNLAAYKCPKTCEFVKSLPKNPQGKILKRELAALYKNDKEQG
ncbi:MAG: acyl-CoA synthetase [Desulfobacteraceae bacterium]